MTQVDSGHRQTPDVCVVAVDLGNSAAKWSIDRCGQSHRVLLRLPNWIDSLVDSAVSQTEGKTISWRIASVNRPVTKLLIARLEEFLEKSPGVTVRVIDASDVPIEVCVANPDRVGIDRLLAAWQAAVTYHGQSSIVVDAGSAITVDVVSARGQFLGGAILPGIALQFESLARGTDALPAIDFMLDVPDDLTQNAFDMPATDTVSAIRTGILLGTAAAIDGLIKHRVCRMEPSDGDPRSMPILFTGGDAKRLSGLIQHPHEVRACVVLDAIHELKL